MCFTRTCVPHNRTHRSRRRSFAVWLHSRSLKHAARQLLLWSKRVLNRPLRLRSSAEVDWAYFAPVGVCDFLRERLSMGSLLVAPPLPLHARGAGRAARPVGASGVRWGSRHPLPRRSYGGLAPARRTGRHTPQRWRTRVRRACSAAQTWGGWALAPDGDAVDACASLAVASKGALHLYKALCAVTRHALQLLLQTRTWAWSLPALVFPFDLALTPLSPPHE